MIIKAETARIGLQCGYYRLAGKTTRDQQTGAVYWILDDLERCTVLHVDADEIDLSDHPTP